MHFESFVYLECYNDWNVHNGHEFKVHTEKITQLTFEGFNSSFILYQTLNKSK